MQSEAGSLDRHRGGGIITRQSAVQSTGAHMRPQREGGWKGALLHLIEGAHPRRAHEQQALLPFSRQLRRRHVCEGHLRRPQQQRASAK